MALDLRRLFARVRLELADAIVGLAEHVLPLTRRHGEDDQIPTHLLLLRIVDLLFVCQESTAMEVCQQPLGIREIADRGMIQHDSLEELNCLLNHLRLIQCVQVSDHPLSSLLLLTHVSFKVDDERLRSLRLTCHRVVYVSAHLHLLCSYIIVGKQ
jgi:hypothetical protein